MFQTSQPLLLLKSHFFVANSSITYSMFSLNMAKFDAQFLKR